MLNEMSNASQLLRKEACSDMKTSIFTSIRAKIIALMFLGIAGMLMVTAANTIFDLKKTRNINVAHYSQQISESILKAMMLEEQFISSNDSSILSSIKKLRGEMKTALAAIKDTTDNGEIQKITAQLDVLANKHVKIFNETSKTLNLLTKTRINFKETDDAIVAELNKTISGLNERETLLLMEGEVLPTEEKLVGSMMKDFISFDGGKTINILTLFIFSNTENYLEQTKAYTSKLQKMVGDIKNILELAKSKELNRAWERIYALMGKNQEQEHFLYKTWLTKQKLLQDLKINGDKIQAAANHIVTSAKNNIDRSIQTSRLTGMVISVVGLLATLLVGIMIIISIVKPIKNTVNMLKDIAEGEGDLTKRLEVKSRDEIGELARWFNQFIDKVQVIIAEVENQVKLLKKSATTLTELSTGMSSGAEKVLDKASYVASAAEEMSSNTGAIANTSKQATDNINMTATSVQEMTTVINEIAGNTAKARTITSESVSQTNSANQQVNELGEAALEIGKVIETITSISSQVNLLALNATIEAARAGESGKGFAVVANEIKALAQQTADAAGEIQERVESIQSTTKGTVTEIETVTVKVNEVNDIVSMIAAAIEEQSVTTREIADNIVEVSANLSEANDNISQSSTVASDIAREISEVTVSTGGLTDSSTQVNLQSNELSDLANQLEKIVKQFKI